MSQRKLSEAMKKRIAGKQRFQCANKPGKKIKGLENYNCPLWDSNSKERGNFDETGYEIDHKVEFSISEDDSEENLQALCHMCHLAKTKRFMMDGNRKMNRDITNKNKWDIMVKFFDECIEKTGKIKDVIPLPSLIDVIKEWYGDNYNDKKYPTIKDLENYVIGNLFPFYFRISKCLVAHRLKYEFNDSTLTELKEL